MTHRYDDIIHLPHPTSGKHPRMPRPNRAAQFAPFAALSGYEDAVSETARLTNRMIEPDEDSLSLLNDRLHALMADDSKPEVVLTVFEPDEQKEGGCYLPIQGRIRRVDEAARTLILTDRTVIEMERILRIDFPNEA